jgi:hypothetical protein
MARYSTIPIITTTEDPKRRYINTKYPEIKPEFADTYVYTTVGDRYDLLALRYYKDVSLWWVISRANPSQPSDSLFPNSGEQIRIPAASRLASILGAYDNLNRTI